MVGTVKQQIYIKAIPKGMKMRITALNLLPPDPPKEWRATLQSRSGVALKAPFDFNPAVNNGHLGEVVMYGSHAFPSKSLGARLEILWELIGTATFNAEGQVIMETSANDPAEHPAERSLGAADDDGSPTLEPPCAWPPNPGCWATKLDDLPPLPLATANANTGRFIVETSEWGLVERPDYASVLYQIGSETPLRVVSKIAATIIGMPMDALFVIGANGSTQKIGINATQDVQVANTLISNLLKGIFLIHEKAFGWLFERL